MDIQCGHTYVIIYHHISDSTLFKHVPPNPMRVPSDGRSQGSTVAFWMPVASDIFPYAQSKITLWL